MKSTWKRESDAVFRCDTFLQFSLMNVQDAYLLCLGMLQDLFQRVVRVIAADGILLQVTKMNVCSNEDLESILIIP